MQTGRWKVLVLARAYIALSGRLYVTLVPQSVFENCYLNIQDLVRVV